MRQLFSVDNNRVDEECEEDVDAFFHMCLEVTREQTNDYGPSEEGLNMFFFSRRVLRVMCQDMAEIVDKGKWGALEMLRKMGAKAAAETLTLERPLFVWKRALLRRAIRDYLNEKGWKKGWRGLVLGDNTTKMWLTRHMGHVVGDMAIPHHVSSYLVSVLFPKMGETYCSV